MTVNRSYDEDELPLRGYGDRRADPNRADREISLGTATILGIFFVLALVCAAFFGFGYSMGRKSTQTAQLAIPPSSSSPELSATATKPSAGSLPLQRSQPSAQPSENTSASSESDGPQTATVPLNSPNPKNTVVPSDRIIAGDKPIAAPQPTTSSEQPATSFMVQVAAVSTQDVADIEVAALKKQGFDVVVRHEPQDKLLHVQIGPFPDRKSAEAMRQRVLAGGFNAIVK